jgi:uroporphyrin-3 C-methyltransferase
MEDKTEKLTDDDAVEGQIIDVEPEAEAEESASETKQQSASTQFKPRLPLILAIIAMLAVTISWFAGYRYWQHMKNDLVTMQERINSTFAQQQKLGKEIENARNALKLQDQSIAKQAAQTAEQDKKIKQESEQLSRQTEIMRQAVDQVSQKIGRSNNQWQLAEAEYLMRVANHRLSLNRDINTAITALQQADQKLLQSGNLGLISIRNTLAKEINQLKSVQQTDITGMAATLQGLAQQVNQLKLAGAALTRSHTESSDSEKPARRSLDTILEDSWKGFQQLIVVRKHEQPVSAMLPPSQQYFIYQNLQLQFETARLALLRQENIIFRSSLDTAIEWINSFFDIEQAAAKNMLENLQTLKSTELSPAIPDITSSLEQLTQYREEKQ